MILDGVERSQVQQLKFLPLMEKFCYPERELGKLWEVNTVTTQKKERRFSNHSPKVNVRCLTPAQGVRWWKSAG